MPNSTVVSSQTHYQDLPILARRENRLLRFLFVKRLQRAEKLRDDLLAALRDIEGVVGETPGAILNKAASELELVESQQKMLEHLINLVGANERFYESHGCIAAVPSLDLLNGCAAFYQSLQKLPRLGQFMKPINNDQLRTNMLLSDFIEALRREPGDVILLRHSKGQVASLHHKGVLLNLFMLHFLSKGDDGSQKHVYDLLKCEEIKQHLRIVSPNYTVAQAQKIYRFKDPKLFYFVVTESGQPDDKVMGFFGHQQIRCDGIRPITFTGALPSQFDRILVEPLIRKKIRSIESLFSLLDLNLRSIYRMYTRGFQSLQTESFRLRNDGEFRERRKPELTDDLANLRHGNSHFSKVHLGFASFSSWAFQIVAQKVVAETINPRLVELEEEPRVLVLKPDSKAIELLNQGDLEKVHFGIFVDHSCGQVKGFSCLTFHEWCNANAVRTHEWGAAQEAMTVSGILEHFPSRVTIHTEGPDFRWNDALQCLAKAQACETQNIQVFVITDNGLATGNILKVLSQWRFVI